jgi:hypothetical protein
MQNQPFATWQNLPNLPTGGGRGQKLRKFGDALNGWSLLQNCSALFVSVSLVRENLRELRELFL